MPAADLVTLLAGPHRAVHASTRLLALGREAAEASWYARAAPSTVAGSRGRRRCPTGAAGGDVRPGCPAYRVRMVRYRVLVSGLVQGVGFRDTCRRTAERQGVSGWVRNLRDGSVEADTLLDWSRRGPRFAEVTDVRVQAEPPEGISGFQIR
jgi:acylphosphatase